MTPDTVIHWPCPPKIPRPAAAGAVPRAFAGTLPARPGPSAVP